MKDIRLAVDFDGTIVENAYPAIGKELPFAFESLKMLQKEGFKIILWTRRSGSRLNDAVEFCLKNGLEFYAVNKSYPEEEYDPSESPKIEADIFIDDRNFGGLPEWGEIYQTLSERPIPLKKTKSNFIKMLFR